MKAILSNKSQLFEIDFSKPIDISIPLSNTDTNPIAWYLDKPTIEPVQVDNWIGKVTEGASINFNNILFNPHAHGTHTECLGHITHDFYSINQQLQKFMFWAKLVTIKPIKNDEDWVIYRHQLEPFFENLFNFEALIIRTLPNNPLKKEQKYSHTNPPYLDVEATAFLKDQNIEHLLIDLPSIDKEVDQGKLASHKAFWNITDVKNISKEARLKATITEFIYVDDCILDGLYLLNLQISSFENDATPSKPTIYKLEKK